MLFCLASLSYFLVAWSARYFFFQDAVIESLPRESYVLYLNFYICAERAMNRAEYHCNIYDVNIR